MESYIKTPIPKYVLEIAYKIKKAGYKVYLVGGSVRDLLLGNIPNDYDLTTDARPEEISMLFKNAKDVGAKFGTILIPVWLPEKKEYTEVEVTTLRQEEKYTDSRHPSKVEFVKDIHTDLKRRDFTINAMAIPLHEIDFSLQPVQAYLKKDKLIKIREYKLPLIDDFDGLKDLKNKIIRAVGDPNDRFSEDALRMIRACRFVAQLEFKLEKQTQEAIQKNAYRLQFIAIERIRDEFLKLLYKAKKPSLGIECLRQNGLLKYIIPELLDTVDVKQPLGHVHDVYHHLLSTVDAAIPRVRMAALLHDIGKPATARPDGHFYGHDIKGAKMTQKILKRLKFPKKEIHRITTLVREHMFFYLPDKWTDSAVRRFIKRVGLNYLDDLFALRMADSRGNPRSEWEPKEVVEFKKHIDKILKEDNAFKVTDLAINGDDLIKELNLKPGPLIGEILDYLLEKVLDNPKLNKKKQLLKLANEYLKTKKAKLAR